MKTMLTLKDTTSSDRIKVRKDNSLNNDEDLELMYFYQSCFLNEEYYNLRKKYIISQYEVMINENLTLLESNNGFISGIINLLKKFMNLVKSLYDRFVSSLMKLKDLFSLLTKKFEKIDFTALDTSDVYFEGYMYTLNSIPVININNLTLNGPFTFNDNIISQLSNDLLLRIDENSKDDAYFDEIRGKILGKFYPISSDNFDKEIKKTLRSNQSKERKILLDDYDNLENIKNSLLNYNDTVSRLLKERNNILDIYKKLIKYFQTALSISVDKSNNMERNLSVKSFTLNNDLSIDDHEKIHLNYDMDTYDKIKKYTIARSKEVNTISQLISRVFSGKLEAYKEKYNQDINIIKSLLIQK